MEKLTCQICLKEYDQDIIFSYVLNTIACIPCIKIHEKKHFIEEMKKQGVDM